MQNKTEYTPTPAQLEVTCSPHIIKITLIYFRWQSFFHCYLFCISHFCFLEINEIWQTPFIASSKKYKTSSRIVIFMALFNCCDQTLLPHIHAEGKLSVTGSFSFIHERMVLFFTKHMAAVWHIDSHSLITD